MDQKTSRKSAPSAPFPLTNGRTAARAPPAQARSRSLHWLAWGAALASIAVAVVWRWAGPDAGFVTILQGVDVGLALFFALEFFTRTGWRRSRIAYVKWRWFDFIALLPVTVLGPAAIAPVFWVVLACRVIRAVDRTLGDGFVQRNVLVVAGAVEEEISDRVLEKLLLRWEEELEDANFGTAMAAALERNREAVLHRVFAEQFQEGAVAKVAQITGLRSKLEDEERRLFAAVVEIVGSPEISEAIRDVIASSLRRTREQLGARDWRRKLGVTTQVLTRPARAFAPRPVPPGARLGSPISPLPMVHEPAEGPHV